MRHASRWNLGPRTAPAAARRADHVLRGSVCLYQGEELGLTEADVAFEDLQDPYGIQFWPNYKGRDGCRTPMAWISDNRTAGFRRQALAAMAVEHLHRAVATSRASPGQHAGLLPRDDCVPQGLPGAGQGQSSRWSYRRACFRPSSANEGN
jgi:alpha-glucosidase